jgi:uncharacterized phage protein (TIGR01671 family)
MHETVGSSLKTRKIITNNDNEASRRITETCTTKNQVILNPIIEWSEDEVWEYIKERELPYNPLYDAGHKRVGCIGCPMKSNKKELDENPRWAALYKKAAQKYLDKENTSNYGYRRDIKTYYNWWLDFCDGISGSQGGYLIEDREELRRVKMREILFRGKQINSKEWLYGNLIKSNRGTVYIFPFEITEEDGHHIRMDTDSPQWVIPETVGQYTGLDDKNGKKIFEGDIVKTLVNVGDVQFSHGLFGFEWVANKKSKTMLGGWGQRHNLKSMDDDVVDNIEVIGNIHDNPELLQSEDGKETGEVIKPYECATLGEQLDKFARIIGDEQC